MKLTPLLKLFIQALLTVVFLSLSVSGCTTPEDKKSAVEGELDSELDDLSDDESLTEDSADTDLDDSALTAEDEAALDGDDEGAKEDDEFLAEDADAPAEDKLAGDALDKELNKDVADVAAPPPPPESTPPPSAPEDMVASSAPAPGANSDSGIVTSKESTRMMDEGFDFVTPAPTLPQDDLGVSDPLVTEVDPPLPSLKAAKELVPLTKMTKNPYYVNERLMNAVYIVRPNEDLGTISQKIYGENKEAQLLADNDHLPADKSLMVGDKIYYNSPNRPEDKKAILTYYEDNKMAPSYYTTQSGDDIQAIGRRVLGFDDGWKEVYTVNETLQTQALLPAGIKIKYWTGNEMKSMASDTSGNLPAETPQAVGQVEDTSEVPVDIPASPDQQVGAVNTDDPEMASQISNEALPLPPDNVPAPATVSKDDGGLATTAGLAIVGLAVLALVAIQIKNRKKNDSGLPPSLEFTKV